MNRESKSNWEKAILKVFQVNNNQATLQTLYRQVPKFISDSSSEDIQHTIRAYLSRLKQKNIIEQIGESSYSLHQKQSLSRHKNYEILNLIGYGLAKFEIGFIKCFGFKTKTAFYSYMINLGIAETIGTIKNRQDLFDPFFENKRKGWWQKGDTYLHRKVLIDSLFGKFDLFDFCNIVKLFIKEKYNVTDLITEKPSPIIKSRFKQLQTTGLEAEEYFVNNFRSLDQFKSGQLEDARILGDGYDFQIDVDQQYFLVEVKRVKTNYGGLRLTEKEFYSARQYKNQFALVVISNLIDVPKINAFFNPMDNFQFSKKIISTHQTNYHIGAKNW